MDLRRFAEQGTDPEHRLTAVTGAQQLLSTYIQEHSSALLGILRSYVQRMGLATGPAVSETVLEVFHETVTEALAHAARFNEDITPRAWLLGIAVNVIKRQKTARAKRSQREMSLGDLIRHYPDLPDENAMLDTLLPPVTTGPAQIVEANEQVAALLALVSPEDQHILSLAVLEGYQHIPLAKELGTTPGTARMRLHRALQRLRAAWVEQQSQKGPDHV